MIRGFSIPLDIPNMSIFSLMIGLLVIWFIYLFFLSVSLLRLDSYLLIYAFLFALCVILMNIGFHNAYIFFRINVCISLAAGLLRILCADSSIREQVKVFDGIPICLRWEMLPFKCVTLHQVGVQSLKQLSSRSTCLLCIIKRNIGKASLGFVHMNLDSF